MASGWYYTGDVAGRDEDGNITYIGRTDDIFKASDYKVSRFEVESLLLEHPAVAEAAVVRRQTRCGSPCARRTSHWIPRHEPDAETARSILVHEREHLAPYLRGAAAGVLRAPQDRLRQAPVLDIESRNVPVLAASA